MWWPKSSRMHIKEQFFCHWCLLFKALWRRCLKVANQLFGKCTNNVKVKVIQSCLTLWDPMDYTVHDILQARIAEWVAFPFSRESSQPRDWTHISLTAGGSFTSWGTREVPHVLQQQIILVLGFNSSSGFVFYEENMRLGLGDLGSISGCILN